MKALATLIVALLASVPQALAAAQDSAPAWNGFAATFFITFAATVFIFQLFPGAALAIHDTQVVVTPIAGDQIAAVRRDTRGVHAVERAFRDLRTASLMPPTMDRMVEGMGRLALGLGGGMFQFGVAKTST